MLSRSHLSRSTVLILTGAMLTASVLSAQGTKLDRTRQPAPARTPTLKVPSWTTTTLSNGATLVVSRKPELPLVSVNINFLGGANQFESPDKLGVASFTAQMLTEGTTTRTGDQLSDAQQKLGTNIRVNIGDESGSMGFTALSDKLDAALDLVADMILNPSLPADALERRRAQRLVQLTQEKDEGEVVANNVFYQTVYGSHPYGWVVNEATTKAITRDDIVAFHRNYFQPGRASITVVGDVDPARVKASFERAFAKWSAGGAKPNFAYPATPTNKARTIYLIDKPKAAQSSVVMGLTGPSRDTPDYYAISVMNHILGGLFQSRLNHLIREVKGYSYGVGSGFEFGRGPGAFMAGGEIVTEKSDSALMDFVNELRGVQGGKPFTEDEIKQGKESLVQGLPRRFASVDGVAGAISQLYTQDLPQTYFQEYAAKINAVTSDDLVRVAKKYIDLDNISIVIVGDREVIEPKLRATGIAPIVLLNVDGKPVVTP
jgi:predicted Zn-dependent peptidase